MKAIKTQYLVGAVRKDKKVVVHKFIVNAYNYKQAENKAINALINEYSKDYIKQYSFYTEPFEIENDITEI